MPQYKTVIDLFGEAVELRASSFMSQGVPISCIFPNGNAVPDVALIRPYDGLVQYDEEKLHAAVEDVRSRQSTGFNVFFLVTRPILFVFEMVMALLQGIGGFFSRHAVLGFFSIGFAFITIVAVVMALGAMAMVFIYAAPFLLLVFIVRMIYRSGSQDAVEKLKKGSLLLSEIVAKGEAGDVVEVGADGTSPGDGVVIDGQAMHVQDSDRLPLSSSRPMATAGASQSGKGQISTGLKIGLMAAIPLGAVIIIFGPKMFGSPANAPIPATTLQPQIQKPATVVPTALPPQATPIPTAQTGVPEVLDTATLRLNGQRIPLAGLRAVEMPEAAAAARHYLAQAGGVRCEPASVGGWRCASLAKGLDIAEVFALSGFAKAAANAPDVIRNAEGMARENRRGVWGAS